MLDEFLCIFINSLLIQKDLFCMPDWFLFMFPWVFLISSHLNQLSDLHSVLSWQRLQSISHYNDYRAGDPHRGAISIGGSYCALSDYLVCMFCTWIQFPPVSRCLAFWPVIFQHIRTDQKSSQWECVTLSCGRLSARDLFVAASSWIAFSVQR